MAKATSHLGGKLRINFCAESDMRFLPNVVRIVAERMSEFKSKHGNITKRNILDIPNLNISRQFIAMIDFAENPAYSSVPCRTDLSDQEMKLESTPSVVGWEDQSPETWSRSDVSGASSKSRRQSRLSSVGKRVPIPAYSPGGTPTLPVPIATRQRRPAYSPGGTPTRPVPKATRQRGPAYSPGGTPTRPVPKATRQRRPAYSPGGTPTRPVPKATRQRGPAYSPGGTPVRRQNFGMLVSSAELSDEDTSSEESDFIEAEFAQERFLLASQAPEESLYEWAERLKVLAFKAFKGNSHSYVNKLFIRQFCLECIDPKAGKYALGYHPETLDNAMDHIKQYFMTYHQKQLQSPEASCSKDLSTDGLNVAQSQRNPSPAIKSPFCDPHITKSPVCDSSIAVTKSPVCDSSIAVTKRPVCDPLVIKSPVSDSPNSNSTAKSPVADPQIATTEVKVNKSKTKKTKAKKRKSTVAHQTENLPLDKDSKKCSVAIASIDLLEHSSRVDEELRHTAVESNAPKGTDGSHKVNKSLSPMVDELNDEPDDSYGRLIRHTEPKYLYELQFCETVSSIPVVSVNSCEVSDTEEWTIDPSSLSVTEKPRILMGLKPDILKSSREHKLSTELVLPCWNISENHAVCSTGVSSDVSDLSQISNPSLSSLGPRVEIERGNERMAEVFTEEVLQSSKTMAVKEDDLFLEIEEILAAEIASETFDKQSCFSEAEKAENLFLEIEQIITAEIVHEITVVEITREAAVESPVGESITEAAVDACITTEIVSPVGEINNDSDVGNTCTDTESTETVAQELTCTTESVFPVSEMTSEVVAGDITRDTEDFSPVGKIISETATLAIACTNKAVSPDCEIAREAVLALGTDIPVSEHSYSMEQAETHIIATAKSDLLCGDDDNVNTQTELVSDRMPNLGSCGKSILLADVGQSSKTEDGESECRGSKWIEKELVSNSELLSFHIEGPDLCSTSEFHPSVRDGRDEEFLSVEASDRIEAELAVSQSHNQDLSGNMDQGDILIVPFLISHLVNLAKETTANQDFAANGIEASDRDHDCQSCLVPQTEASVHFGQEPQSRDLDPDDIVAAEQSTTTPGNTCVDEQDGVSGSSRPKQWDPGGSLAGTSI